MKFFNYYKEKNRIKSLNTIEDEGENLYYLGVEEQCEVYNNYSIGDLILVKKYKYRNGNWGENHIFLIVEIDNNKKNIMYYRYDTFF